MLKRFKIIEGFFPCAEGDLLLELAAISKKGSPKEGKEVGHHLRVTRMADFSNRLNILRRHKWPPADVDLTTSPLL